MLSVFRALRRSVPAAAVLLSIAAACGRAGDASAPAGESGGTALVNVVATTGLVADAAREVGGAHVRVTALMGPGVDPHLYKASAGDVERMTRADLLLYCGLHLEGAMTEVFERLQGRKATRAVAEAIPADRLITAQGFAGAHDPHVWFDVTLWKYAVTATRDALIEVAPAHRQAFEANAARYLAELDQADAYVRQRAASLPAERRVLVTAHDAFGYFGRAYGFEVRGLQGVSTATEAGAADVRVLAELLVTRKLPALFVESSVPRRTIEAVQAAVAARGSSVAIGGSLYSDALGDPGGPAGTYVGMVRTNIDTIVGALGGGSPPSDPGRSSP